MTDKLSNRGWLLKTTAALIPGALLSLGGMVLLGGLCGSTGNPMMLSSQYLMWFAAVCWTLCFCVCFLFRNGLVAWIGFGGAAFIVWLAIAALSVFDVGVMS